LYDVTHGHDPEDPVSSELPRAPVLPSIGHGIAGLKIARAVGYFEEEITADALYAVETVAKALNVSESCIVPEALTARNAAMIVSAVEGSALHISSLRTRPSDFDPLTRDRFIAGALMPGEAYASAQMFRAAFRESTLRIFSKIDLLIAAATPMVAPAIGQTEIEIEGAIFPARAHLGRFTQPISFIGLPVIVVPLQTGSALPIGVQLIGAPHTESVLFRAANYLQQVGVAMACAPPRFKASANRK
jgi:1-carboxybiuret hydrolase